MSGSRVRYIVGNTAGGSPTPASKWEAPHLPLYRQGSSPPEGPCRPNSTADCDGTDKRNRHGKDDEIIHATCFIYPYHM